MERNAVNHSAHSTWRCQYHIVFMSKYRGVFVYKQIYSNVGMIMT